VAFEAGVLDRFRWIGQLSQQVLFALYRSMHCFLFPSLHVSSGNVVLEAQANGLPVICLDLGGPATLVAPDAAIVVDTQGRNEGGVVNELAKAVERLATDEASRFEMGKAAITNVREKMTWNDRVYGALALLKN
jgi:glycosyltransferase involved in cell wall biosynthesis